MNTIPEQNLHGFQIISTEALPEIDGEAFVLEHQTSKAKLLYLKNDDNNKAFSISFKTPPVNDTGVFHILEHSVLCGSRKFPVKEPFVNLLKSSMQTFLNAMTFPDKTMYPVASTNEQDLLNLMDVYLDAVLHPQIYNKKAIFQQEGWHFEVAKDEDGEKSAGNAAKHSLRYNGVVYNEMKGVFSDSSSVLYWRLMQELFPDTAYRFESGGEPQSIPDLSYEEYLDEHSRHYRLDNSYITLYGNVDIDKMLAFLDTNYLTPVAHEEEAQRNERLKSGKVQLAPHELSLQAPTIARGVKYDMVTAPENAVAAFACVAGKATDRLDMLALNILLDAIGGSNEAPLKRALLDAQLAADASIMLVDSLLQPFAVVMLHGLSEGGAEKMRNVCLATLKKLADGELDHDLIEASLSRSEFLAREGEYGYPDGVAHAMGALASWLYDDNMPCAYLHYQEEFDELRRALSTTYYEDLIRRVFLESNHWAEVEIVPVQSPEISEEEQRLDRIALTFTENDFAQTQADEALLRQVQEAPDLPADLATLPTLSVSDIGEAPTYPQPTLSKETRGYQALMRHNITTHGIVYAYRFFDMKCLTFEELPYASLLATMLGRLDTTNHTAAELDTLVNGKLGNFSVFADVSEDAEDIEKVNLRMVVGASALKENNQFIGKLTHEILTETLFEDSKKLKDVLQQRRVAMEQSFSANGHASARARLTSYYSNAGVVREQLGGVDFYRFVKQLLQNFDSKAPATMTKLADLAKRLFHDDTCILSFTGSDNELEEFLSCGGILGTDSCQREALPTSGEQFVSPTSDIASVINLLVIPSPTIKNEAFIVPGDVCYSATGFDSRLFDETYTGAWQVASRALTFDYLWNEVRVKGGAYGVGFQAARTGTLRFWSYRDPRLDETIERFEGAASWLSRFNPTNEEMEGFIVASVAEFDTPCKARQIIRRQINDYITNRTPEDRARTRQQMIEATPETLQSLAPRIEEALSKKAWCAIGSAAILDSSERDFTRIVLLDE